MRAALIRKDGEYPLYDGLGSERTVTNASQTVTGTLNLDAFGNLAGSTGSSTNPYLYAATSGYRNDGDAGLMHVGARYYDSQMGRWTSRDTVLTEHPYLYCGHDPVNATDPGGHFGQALEIIGILVVLVGLSIVGVPALFVAGAVAMVVGTAMYIAGALIDHHEAAERAKLYATPIRQQRDDAYRQLEYDVEHPNGQ